MIYARFSDYELFEEELRPFEITSPDGHRNCVFPSQTTIASGIYPLSTQVLITTTTRSLKRDEVTDFLKDYLNVRAGRGHRGRDDRPDRRDAARRSSSGSTASSQPVLVVPAEDEAETDADDATEPGAPAR